jgi:hypothetical protein|tara:strand:- start:47 stop:496 length:450 start_codon:yes stop_codon:yes gene_type:complete
MDETGQKNAILICTCIIVICFHTAYKFNNNQKLFNILIGIALFTSLGMTKFLRDWENKNKTDYNLVLFIYILLDIVIFSFMVLRFCASRNILKGGGDKSQDMTKYFVDEFKQQDRFVKFLDTPGVLKIANMLKEKAANFALRKIGFFGI